MNEAQTRYVSPEPDDAVLGVYRRMSGSEKLALMGHLNAVVKEGVIDYLRRLHPKATERELQLRFASLNIDRATMIKAFGFDPGEPGA